MLLPVQSWAWWGLTKVLESRRHWEGQISSAPLLWVDIPHRSWLQVSTSPMWIMVAQENKWLNLHRNLWPTRTNENEVDVWRWNWKLTSQREACRALAGDLSSGSKTVPWPITRANTWAKIIRLRASWSYARGRHCLKPLSLLAVTKCAKPVITSSRSSDSFCETRLFCKASKELGNDILTEERHAWSIEPSSEALSSV